MKLRCLSFVSAAVVVGVMHAHTSWASSTEQIDLSPLGTVVESPAGDPGFSASFDRGGLMKTVYGPEGEILLSYALDREAGTLAVTNSLGETRLLTLGENGLVVSVGEDEAQYTVTKDEAGVVIETCITNELLTECYDGTPQLLYRHHLETGEEFFFGYESDGELIRITTGSGEEVFLQTTEVVDGVTYTVLRLEEVTEWYLGEQLVFRLNDLTLEERHLEYTATGHLEKVWNEQQELIWFGEYTLGESGEVIRVTVTVPEAVEVYDGRGLILSRTDRVSGEEWLFFYNDSEQLWRIEDRSGNVLLENFYDENGELLRTDMPEGGRQIDYGPSVSASSAGNSLQRIKDEDGNIVTYNVGVGVTVITDETRNLQWVLDNNQLGSPLVKHIDETGQEYPITYAGMTASIHQPDGSREVYEYIAGQLGRHLRSEDKEGEVTLEKSYDQRRPNTVYVAFGGESYGHELDLIPEEPGGYADGTQLGAVTAVGTRDGEIVVELAYTDKTVHYQDVETGVVRVFAWHPDATTPENPYDGDRGELLEEGLWTVTHLGKEGEKVSCAAGVYIRLSKTSDPEEWQKYRQVGCGSSVGEMAGELLESKGLGTDRVHWMRYTYYQTLDRSTGEAGHKIEDDGDLGAANYVKASDKTQPGHFQVYEYLAVDCSGGVAEEGDSSKDPVDSTLHRVSYTSGSSSGTGAGSAGALDSRVRGKDDSTPPSGTKGVAVACEEGAKTQGPLVVQAYLADGREVRQGLRYFASFDAELHEATGQGFGRELWGHDTNQAQYVQSTWLEYPDLYQVSEWHYDPSSVADSIGDNVYTVLYEESGEGGNGGVAGAHLAQISSQLDRITPDGNISMTLYDADIAVGEIGKNPGATRFFHVDQQVGELVVDAETENEEWSVAASGQDSEVPRRVTDGLTPMFTSGQSTAVSGSTVHTSYLWSTTGKGKTRGMRSSTRMRR